MTSDSDVCNALQLIRSVMLYTLRSRVAERPVINNWRALLDYLHASMAHESVEQFRVLHLNTRNVLVKDEVMQRGTIDQAAVYVREVVRRAVDLHSAALILVHNHPSGNPSPSRADIDITRAVAAAAHTLGIAVHDHLVIGTHGHTSLRSRGLF